MEIPSNIHHLRDLWDENGNVILTLVQRFEKIEDFHLLQYLGIDLYQEIEEDNYIIDFVETKDLEYFYYNFNIDIHYCYTFNENILFRTSMEADRLKVFLDLGADPNVKNINGAKFIHNFIYHDLSTIPDENKMIEIRKVFEVLIDYNIDLYSLDGDDYNILDLYIAYYHPDEDDLFLRFLVDEIGLERNISDAKLKEDGF